MRKIVLLFCSALVTIPCLFWPQNIYTKIPAPPAGRTNAPSESNCATSTCHAGTAIDATTEVSLTASLSGGPAVDVSSSFLYKPDSTYTMEVSVLDLTGRYGFELCCLKMSDNTNAGTFTIVDPVNTSAISGGGRNYVGHKDASSVNTWTFEWTAPSAGTADVKFYMCCNAANNSGSSSGDKIYKYSAACAEDATDSVTALRDYSLSGIRELQSFWNPSTGNAAIRYQSEWIGTTKLQLIDLSGKLLKEFQFESMYGSNYQSLPMSNIAKGMYFVKLSIADKVATTRFLVHP